MIAQRHALLPLRRLALLAAGCKGGVMNRTWQVFGLAAWLGAGCGKAPIPEQPPTYGHQPVAADQPVEYVFAVNPLHNPVRLFEIYQPLVDFINTQTKDFTLKLEASDNFAAFEDKLAHRTLHFVLPNPYQTLQAEKTGYRVFAKRGDDEMFRGVILVRKDSGINQISDLKGAAISFPAPTALAACLMPKYFMKQQGLDVDQEAKPLYVGSQESAIMNVYQGQTKAGVTWLVPWLAFVKEKPELAETLILKWQTDSLPNNSLMVREDVPAPHWQKVRDLLLALHTHDTGRVILARMNLSRFDPATSATYEPVREFMKKYEAAFSPKAARGETP